MFDQEPFLIAQVFPTDLTRAGLTEEQIAELTYFDMRQLAYQMQQLYFAGPFLSHLQQAVKALLAEKEERRFTIASVSRSDLLRVGYSTEEVADITDSDLAKLAQRMFERYGHRLYDADLMQLAGIIISEKEAPTNEQAE